jgi:UDP-3-O-[3-hydroxymyristoyl] glucosamine N-acyltransferase
MNLFGVSNKLSDIYECINLLGKRVTQIVNNIPEETRERTKDFKRGPQELTERPLIMPLEDFAPHEDEEYFVVPATPRKSVFIEYLKKTYQLQFSHLIHPTAYISPIAKVGQGIFIGATVIEELVIGKGAVVSAGAVVIKDVKENTLVAGVPAIVKKEYDKRARDAEGLVFRKAQSGPHGIE